MNILRSFGSDAHWYTRQGLPMHTVMGKTTGRPRPTNITDARKLDLLPSVTSITGILRKPALERWKMEQAVLAALTTPRLVAETEDAFVERVLNVEKQQEAEAETARNLGTDIHAAIQGMLAGEQVPDELKVYVEAARTELAKFDGFSRDQCETEKVVIGNGYAGRTDLIVSQPEYVLVVDFKTCKTIPKHPYPENGLQLGAYLGAGEIKPEREWRGANIFISTTEPGKAVTMMHQNLPVAYETFLLMLEVWKWLNNF